MAHHMETLKVQIDSWPSYGLHIQLKSVQPPKPLYTLWDREMGEQNGKRGNNGWRMEWHKRMWCWNEVTDGSEASDHWWFIVIAVERKKTSHSESSAGSHESRPNMREPKTISLIWKWILKCTEWQTSFRQQVRCFCTWSVNLKST